MLPLMGKGALRTAFVSLGGIGAVSAAVIAQRIQRAVTKKAIEKFAVTIVAGEKGAVLVLKIGKIVLHKFTP